MNQKQAEILKAAKSLFSKRTRTLFHWMYPNTPKPQLKAAVSHSWENLGLQEKEFYISQVLGRFGFPQTSLMVNPQLNGIKDANSKETSPNSVQLQNSLVTSLLNGDYLKNNNHLMQRSKIRVTGGGQRLNKKKVKISKPTVNIYKMEEENVIREIQTENNGDEFQDDPELSREFEQFKWTLHLNDKKC